MQLEITTERDYKIILKGDRFYTCSKCAKEETMYEVYIDKEKILWNICNECYTIGHFEREQHTERKLQVYQLFDKQGVYSMRAYLIAYEKLALGEHLYRKTSSHDLSEFKDIANDLFNRGYLAYTKIQGVIYLSLTEKGLTDKKSYSSLNPNQTCIGQLNLFKLEEYGSF